jgi:hypothetical protein
LYKKQQKEETNEKKTKAVVKYALPIPKCRPNKITNKKPQKGKKIIIKNI